MLPLNIKRLPDLFHPLIARWFSRTIGGPTQLQERAWNHIAQGDHLLLTAPTGSGKTLAAFLWAINQLIQGHWVTGSPCVLYVSPLKALNEDIRRNLRQPLQELKACSESDGVSIPDISIATRSGDTPPEERRRMLRQPPQILITTPESLNLLLSSKGGRTLLRGLKTVILDELHAILGSKRGTHLITAVERLVALSGEFQRIGLSATIRPPGTAAAFLGGYQRLGARPQYVPRPVKFLCDDSAQSARRYNLSVGYYGMVDPEKPPPPGR